MLSGAGQKDLLQIAAVLKSNGTEGEVLLGLKDLSPEDIDTKEPVFIYHDGLPVPYFIENLTVRGSKALVMLTGIHSREDAEEICGRPVFARSEDYPDLEDEDGLEALVGWTVYGQNGRKAGKITGVEDIPGNPCIEVSAGGNSALLPLSEELILSLDPEKQTLEMIIPEGLLDY